MNEPVDEHRPCPKCGYDLYGIPAVRCPECGFGFDLRALDSTSAAAEWTRWSAAQAVMVRSLIAAVLILPAVLLKVNMPAWAGLLLILGAYLGAFVTWAMFTDAYRGLQSVPVLMVLFFGLALAYEALLTMLPFLMPVLGGTVLVWAWIPRLRNWPELPSGSDRPDRCRRSVLRRSAAATAMLYSASILLVVAVV